MADISMDFSAVNTTMTCFVSPPRSNSRGVLGGLNEQAHFLTYSMPLLELQMGIIIILSHLLRFLLKPFGISTFVSCILAGMILGPNGLGKFRIVKETIFPHTSQDTIYTAVMLGYNLYMFLTAVKMEVGLVLRTGRKALSIGITSTMVPFISFFIYQRVQQQRLALTVEDSLVVVIAVATSLPVIAYVIDQLKLTNTELGRLGLASGLVADLSGVCIFATEGIWKSDSVDESMRKLIPVLLFLLLLVLVIRPAMVWVTKNTPNKKPVNTTFIYMIMAFAIGSEAYFFAINQPQFFAPFLFGLAVPSGVPLGSALVEKFESFTAGVLMNILVPTAFMRADLYLIVTNFSHLTKTMGIISLAFLVKMAGCVMPSVILKMPVNEALALAFILNYTGFVHLNAASLYRDLHFLSEDTYSMVALYILFNATFFPFIVKKLYQPSKGYEGYQIRNVFSLKPRAELKILTCIYRRDDVESYIRLLDAIHPTKERPIAVYALHLIELIGRFLPIMISHSKHKPICTDESQNIIYAFNKYEQNNWDSVSVQLFTGLSSFALMHEDIFNIAVEKKTSLIILPLHRRWSMYGYIKSQDKRWRSVNCRVLENVPCSVAIFFSRGSLRRQRSARATSSNLSVCMIFFGGNDDREALTLVKRMAKESDAKVTILHFIPKDSPKSEESEDVVVLEDIKQMAATNECLDYIVHAVEDGPETVKIVRSMANNFDLFVVGRRYEVPTSQTSGLSQWSELPELGVIGDFFASKDLETKASVLVVQQQEQLW